MNHAKRFTIRLIARRKPRSTRMLLWILSVLAVAAGAMFAGALGRASENAPPAAAFTNRQAVADGPVRTTSDVALASSSLRSAVERLRGGRPAPQGVDVTDGNVRIEILHSLNAADLHELVTRLGGSRVRPIDYETAEATVPFERLEALEAVDGVSFVRPPLVANAPEQLEPNSPENAGAVNGQHVTKTNAVNWHVVGHRGNGVKIGIVDSFSAPHWNAAAASGDLPNPAGVFCIENGAGCDIWTQNASTHGVSVAELVYDMAPGASLYLAKTGSSSAADLHAAVDYLAGQGVRVITRSLTAQYDGAGDGTGPIATVIDNAVSRGIVWLNSAGNSGGTPANPGAYWRGAWADNNNNGYLDFAPGDEALDFDCAFINGLRWNDWGAPASRTDYELYVYDDFALTVVESASEDNQAGGAPALEHVGCSSSGDIDYLVVKLFAPGGSGTAGDTLELMTNGASTQYWQNSYSATGPASDTASAGALSIGAVQPWEGTSIASYSSQGPSNDNRLKPDLSAASCVSTVTTGAGCFSGTSAATPVAAGAAALYIGANPWVTPAQVKSYLLTQAFVDRGAAGPDNVFGVGELRLPSLTTSPPPPPLPPPPLPPPPPPLDRKTPADIFHPSVRALPATGFRGSLIKLRYRVSDNSGTSREIVQVIRRKTQVVRRIQTRYGPTGRVDVVRWRAPVRGAGEGSWRFCVRAWDKSRNSSRLSCARIRLRDGVARGDVAIVKKVSS